MRNLKYILPIILIEFCSQASFAQDSNYWANQYGSRSALMGGAVVGGVRDTSAGYYNPGALGFIEDTSINVSGNAYSYGKLSLENGTGTGEDIESSSVQATPTMLSGIYKLDNSHEHTFGYTFLTRTDVSHKFTGRVDRRQNVLQDSYSPGDEEFIGQTNLDYSVKEYWLGGSYAYKISNNISLGATLFGGLRSGKGTNLYFARAVTEDGDLSSVSSTNTYDYYNLRGFGKFGAAADFKPLKLGLTFTTPSFDIAGDGEVTTDITLNDVYLTDETGSEFVSVTGNDRQDGLDAKVKSPFSVALGAEYEIESTKTTIGLTSEYFDSLGTYSVISPTERAFLRPSTTDFGVSNRDFLQIYSAADRVLNTALAVEQPIDEKWKGYLSFRADKSYAKFDNDALGDNANLAKYNLYHVVLGTSYRTDKSETSVGLQYSYGKNDSVQQDTDFATANEDNLFQGEEKETDLDYRAIALILGYTYFF